MWLSTNERQKWKMFSFNYSSQEMIKSNQLDSEEVIKYELHF